MFSIYTTLMIQNKNKLWEIFLNDIRLLQTAYGVGKRIGLLNYQRCIWENTNIVNTTSSGNQPGRASECPDLLPCKCEGEGGQSSHRWPPRPEGAHPTLRGWFLTVSCCLKWPNPTWRQGSKRKRGLLNMCQVLGRMIKEGSGQRTETLIN